MKIIVVIAIILGASMGFAQYPEPSFPDQTIVIKVENNSDFGERREVNWGDNIWSCK